MCVMCSTSVPTLFQYFFYDHIPTFLYIFHEMFFITCNIILSAAHNLQKAQTAVLTSTSCDMLLVAVTQRMTELAVGRVYTATPCTLLVYYTERVTEQLELICGYTVDTVLTQLHHSRIISPEYFPVYANGVCSGE